jgi:cytoskeletal protein CcmA (bactofilin family)
MDKTSQRSSSNPGSCLGRGLAINGRITGDGDLAIEGLIEGEISIDGELRIETQAEVRAKVDAASAVIEGVYEGELNASGAVRIGSAATVRGTVNGSGLSIQQGAAVSITMANDFDLPSELGKSSR